MFSLSKKISIFIVIALLLLAAFIIWAVRGISDFDFGSHITTEITFDSGSEQLSGTLITPQNIVQPPVILLVHGDGAQDRFSDSGYLPLINTLLDQGFAVFSWDKLGVGKSSGSWLDQTMDDRAIEAIHAYETISKLDNIDRENVGFLGFSQAGWVLPRITNQIEPAFTVIIGGAVSWRNQGTYFAKIEMETEGAAQADIAAYLAKRRQTNDIIFQTPADPTRLPDMNPQRFRFVANAYWEDSTDLLKDMQGPVLAIWGEDDLNVDAIANSAIYRQQFSPLSNTRHIIVVPNATHSLLRSNLFNYQLSSQWPWYLSYLYLGMGRTAYQPEALEQIGAWIHSVTKS